MRQLSLLILLFTFSIPGHTAQDSGKKNLERPGLVEKRQNKAREILKNNFNAPERMEERSDKKSSFSFKKDRKKESNQNL